MTTSVAFGGVAFVLVLGIGCGSASVDSSASSSTQGSGGSGASGTVDGGQDAGTSSSTSSVSSSDNCSATACFPCTAIWPLAGASVETMQDGYIFRAADDLHSGIDIPTPLGTVARAILPGKVIEIRKHDVECGHTQYRVTLQHQGDGCIFYSVYNHLMSVPSIVEGDALAQGDAVGSTGWNCDESFPHLHAELRINCKTDDCAVNPLRVLPYPYDASRLATASFGDVAAFQTGRVAVRLESVRDQQDVVQVSCIVTTANSTQTVSFDLEAFQQNGWGAFPGVSVLPESFGLQDATYRVVYAFSIGEAVTSAECWSEDIQGTKTVSIFWP